MILLTLLLFLSLLLLLLISLCIKCYYYLLLLLSLIFLSLLSSSMLSLSVLFLMERGSGGGLEVWQISCDVKNWRNSGSHEVNDNDDNIFIYKYIYIYIYVHLLFIVYLFIYSLFLLDFQNFVGSIQRKGSHLDRQTISLPRVVARWQICKYSYIFVTPQSNPVTSVVIVWW